MTRLVRRSLVCALAGFGVFLVAPVVPLPFQIVFGLLAGWYVFLRDVLPRVTVDRTQLVIAGFALAAFVGGLQTLLRRNVPERIVGGRPWPWRATAAVTGLLMAMFVAGTGLVGIAHQIGWLATSPEPVLEQDPFWKTIERLQEAGRDREESVP